MSPEAPSLDEAAAPRRWRPLEPIQRRVLGVLVEKAKTTPENYPLSLAALRSGCNQKSNRAPLMQLDEPQIEETLEQLRQCGAVTMVQTSGRIDRYRHLAYEWLGVDKVELAVMAELLLRGAQTVGELRGRAARMEPIKDLSQLQPTLDSLHAKGLVVYLTPPGRGCIITHALYQEREWEKLRRDASAAPQSPAGAALHTDPSSEPPAADSTASDLIAQLSRLREELSAVQHEVQSLRDEYTTANAALRRDLDDLNRQLGN